MRVFIIYEPGDYEADVIHGATGSEEAAKRIIRESTEFAQNLLDSLPAIPEDPKGPDGEYTDEWHAVISERMELLKEKPPWPWGIEWNGLDYNDRLPFGTLAYKELEILDPDKP